MNHFKKKILTFLILTTLGILGNIYNAELFFGVNQIFGSIFVLIALWIFGQSIGVLCAILVHAYTIVLWGHPYAGISFVLEAWFVGLLLKRKTQNLFIADAIYWLFIGIPLAYIFYALVMNMSPTQWIMIMFKQPANGLFNALLAGLMVYYIPFEKICLGQDQKKVHFKHILLMLIMGFTMVSIFLSTNMIASQIFNQNFDNIQKEITHHSQQIANQVYLFKRENKREMGLYQQLFHARQQIIRLDKENPFEIIYSKSVQDEEYQIIASKKRKSSFTSLNLTVSTIQDNIQFMPTDPTQIYVFTQNANHDFLYIQKIKYLNEVIQLDSEQDNYHNIIVHEWDPGNKTVGQKGVFQNRHEHLKGIKQGYQDNLYVLFPQDPDLPKMLKWKQAHMVYEISCIGNGFSLAIKQSLKPMMEKFQHLYIYLFGLMLLLIFIATFLSNWLSARMESLIQALSNETSNLPHKLLNEKQPVWPDSPIKEMHSLIQNIQAVANTLQTIFRDSENRFKQLFTRSTDALFVINPKTFEIINANQQAEKLTEQPKHELFHQTINTFFDHFEFDPENIETAIEDFKANIINNNQKVPVQIRIYPMRIRQNDVYCFVVKNIQESVKIQEQLQLIAKVFETTNEGIIITDVHKKILMVNKGFETITGYTSADVTGKDPKIMSSGWHDHHFYQNMWGSIKQEGMWQGEINDRRKNGEIYIQFLSIYAVKDKQEKLTNFIGIFMDITEQRETQQRLQKLTHYDPLTDLPNRMSLMSSLTNAISVASQNELKLGLLLFDMDNFKYINDSFGHKAGDLLLKQVVEKFKPKIQEVGIMARLGADVFAVIFEKLNQTDDLAYFSQKILGMLEAPFFVEDVELYTSVSIGICVYPDDATTAEKMVQYADTAMHRAKDLGKKRFEFYTQAQNEMIRNNILIESGLRKAIQQNQLSVYYQPQVNIESGIMTGCEALLRWHHPEKGFIPPDKFIPIAEESGLIGDIEEWMLKQASRQIKQWRDRGLNLMMSANVSNYQFRKRNFVELTQSIIESEKAQCDWFELELTERIVMDHKEVIEKLDRLKQIGFQLALDDFGTGHSSLAYLKKFNIDKLKIDKSFIQDLPDDSQSRDIVRAIISLADSLNMISIAEGAETKGQLELLGTLGCKAYQGYYFSRPVPVEEFEKLL